MTNAARALSAPSSSFSKAVLEPGGFDGFIREHGVETAFAALAATRDERIPTHSWSTKSSVGATALCQCDVVTRRMLRHGKDAKRLAGIIAGMPQPNTRVQALVLYAEPLISMGQGNTVIRILRDLPKEDRAEALSPLDGPAGALVRNGKGRDVLDMLKGLPEGRWILRGPDLRAELEKKGFGAEVARLTRDAATEKEPSSEVGSGIRPAQAEKAAPDTEPPRRRVTLPSPRDPEDDIPPPRVNNAAAPFREIAAPASASAPPSSDKSVAAISGPPSELSSRVRNTMLPPPPAAADSRRPEEGGGLRRMTARLYRKLFTGPPDNTGRAENATAPASSGIPSTKRSFVPR